MGPAGENIMDHIAGIDDFETAVATCGNKKPRRSGAKLGFGSRGANAQRAANLGPLPRGRPKRKPRRSGAGIHARRFVWTTLGGIGGDVGAVQPP
jgi:hypothetical protein